jgi:hypothetical protein
MTDSAAGQVLNRWFFPVRIRSARREARLDPPAALRAIEHGRARQRGEEEVTPADVQ